MKALMKVVAVAWLVIAPSCAARHADLEDTVALAQDHDEAVQLRYRFTKGERFSVWSKLVSEDVEENVLESTWVEGRDETESAETWEVVRLHPNGDTEIEVRKEYLRKRLSSQGFVLEVDTRVRDQDEILLRLLRVVLETTYRFRVDPRGRVSKVVGIDAFRERYREEAGKLVTDPAERAQVDMLMEGFLGEENIAKTVSTLFIPYPAAAVRDGGTWPHELRLPCELGEMTMRSTFRLEPGLSQVGTRRISSKATFEVTSAIEGLELDLKSGSQDAEAMVDAATGWISEMSVAGRVAMDGYGVRHAERTLVGRFRSDFSGTKRIARKV